MHFLTLVVIPPSYDGDYAAYVEKAMAPYEEGENVEGFWDWYQLGGRWGGHLEAGYEPARDPRNWEPCDLCNGTGNRTSLLPDGTTLLSHWPDKKAPFCNGCSNDLEYTGQLGVKVKWSHDWAQDRGNVARLGDCRDILAEAPPYYLVHEGVSRRQTVNPDWDGRFRVEFFELFLDTSETVTEALAALSDDCIVVVVDVHG